MTCMQREHINSDNNVVCMTGRQTTVLLLMICAGWHLGPIVGVMAGPLQSVTIQQLSVSTRDVSLCTVNRLHMQQLIHSTAYRRDRT